MSESRVLRCLLKHWRYLMEETLTTRLIVEYGGRKWEFTLPQSNPSKEVV